MNLNPGNLKKDYATHVEPIVQKVYANEDILKLSYNFVFQTAEPGAPELSSLHLQISNKLPDGAVVGNLKIISKGDSDIEKITIAGSGNEHFMVDKNGIVSVKDLSEADGQTFYALKATAVNENNRSSIPVECIITVAKNEGIVDANASVPYATSMKVNSIEENSPAGTPVAEVVFHDDNDTIVSYEIGGKDKDAFSVTSDGAIVVSSDANIDYEKQDTMYLNISAINSTGNKSFPVSIIVKIKDVLDTPAYKLFLTKHIKENLPLGTPVAKLERVEGDNAQVTAIDILNKESPFAIDAEGIIRTIDYIDYERKKEYDLVAVARSTSGDSDKIFISIFVDDVDPENGLPEVEDFTTVIPENIINNSVVGTLQIDAGESSVDEIRIYGDTGVDDFVIYKNGTIRVAAYADIDFEKKKRYEFNAIAYNQNGGSNIAKIMIDVSNIPDTPLALKELYATVTENAPVDTVVGSVTVVNQEEGSIVGFTLDGDGSEAFNIDANGTIRVAGVIDYERGQHYSLHAKAQSTVGESEPVNVNITVKNIPEIIPALRGKSYHVQEHVPIGTVVGRVPLIYSGDTPIIAYALDDNTSFTVDRNGTIRTATLLDYETQTNYTLHATATNAAGTSIPVTLTINIDNVIDDELRLKPFEVSIKENTTVGTVIGTIEINNTSTSAISEITLTGDGADKFHVNTDGAVILSGAVDYESRKIYQLQAVATNAKGCSIPVDVTIHILDVPDDSPILSGTSYHIWEDVSIGTVVGRVSPVSAGDAPVTAYTLDDNRTFTISSNGMIRTAAPLDYEKEREYHLFVTATNAFGTSAPADFIIYIDDVIDGGPVLEPMEISIEENATVGTVIGTIDINSTGTSPITQISLSGYGAGKFHVDQNGTITLAQAVDYEACDSGCVYTLRASAENDSGSSPAVSVVVHILNVIDTPPYLRRSLLYHVEENATIGTYVGQVSFHPGDTPITAYALDDNSTFTIDANGTIRTIAPLDYETQARYPLHVMAINAAGTSDPVTLTIDIDDIPDARPVLLYFREHVLESAPVGTVVGTVVWYAQWGDAPDTYALDDNTTFTIDDNGTIRTAAPLDYETQIYHTPRVTATNAFGTSEPVAATIIVDNVVDDEPALEPLEISIGANTPVGTAIGTIEINSTGASPILRIDLTEGRGDAFHVDTNGTITLISSVDREYRNPYTYWLQATALNANGRSAPVNVTIHILTPPVLDGASYHVQENVPIGTVVGTVPLVSDGGGSITAYTLDDNTTFTIDTNGTIRTIVPLDYETNISYYLHATATNAFGTSASVVLRIYIDDVLDARPVIYFRGHVVENSPVGTVVGTVGWDPQSGDAPGTYALDDNTTFTIDNNGTIRTAAPLDYETQTRYTVHVTATNAFGTSEPLAATINIDNVIDGEPVLEPLEISIEENTTVGTVIGTIEINSTGTSPITQITLSGEGAEKFQVDQNGMITLVQAVDYEDKAFCHGFHGCRRYYRLHAAADNDHGHSPSVSVIVHITNVVDTPPQPRGARFHVEENATIGTRVGQLKFYPGEAPIISYTLGDIFYTIDDNGTFRALEDNTTFTIDANGTIYTSAPLDYEKLKNYLLAVTATNAVGTSAPGYAWIIIDNVIDDEPVLADTNLTVPDHAPVGTVVGTLEITTTGTSELNDINLTGEGADHFGVAPDGTITLTQTVDRATQEVYHLQAVAANDKAQSQPVAVMIQVDPMPPAIAGALRFTNGWIWDVARSADGTRAYLADGEEGLLIVDTSDPAHITMLSHFYPDYYADIGDPDVDVDVDENGYAIGVTLSVDGNILYLADGEHGLLIIDVSDPTDPFELGRVGTEHYTMSTTLSADGTTAYVADGDGGLKIVDVRDPENAEVVSEVDSTSWSYQVVLSSDEKTVYLADGNNGLQIIDIQDPFSPYIRNSVDTPGDAWGVTLTSGGDMVYVADGDQGVQLVDVSDPDNLGIIGNFGTGNWAHRITISETESLAYITDGEAGLQIADISDPAHPVVVDTISMPGYAWHAVLSDDARAVWVADSYGGLQIITIDGEGNRAISGTFNTYDKARHIALSHNRTRAYVTTDSGTLKVIDMKTDDDPYIMESVNIDGRMTGLVLTPDEHHICITGENHGLQIVRIDDTDTLSVVSVSDTPGTAEYIVLSGDGTLAYVADGEGGVQIFDISDPTQPDLVGSLDTDGYAQKLVLSNEGTLLYIADGDNGVLQIDVSDPAHPVLQGQYETGEEVTRVLLSGDGTKLYYTVGENIWAIWIDSDDFSRSAWEGVRSIDGRITGLALSRDGRSIYVTEEQTGLRVVSTGNMEVQQTLETDGTAYEVAVSGDGRHVYLADGEAGLVIVNPGSY